MHTIPIKPISVNESLASVNGRHVKTSVAKKYKRDLLLLLPRLKVPDGPLFLIIEFGFSSVLSDTDNCVKLFQDALAEKCGFNDRIIKAHFLDSKIVPKGSEYIKFDLVSYEVTGKVYAAIDSK